MSTKRAIFSLLLLSAVGVVVVDWALSHLSLAEPLIADLNAIQAKQVDIYVQVTQQIFTLATLVLAGVGLFITPERKISTQGPLWLLTSIAVLAGSSMYFGYLSFNTIVWMLSKQFFNLETPILHYLRLAQFWTFIASVFIFAWFWLKQSTQEKSK